VCDALPYVAWKMLLAAKQYAYHNNSAPTKSVKAREPLHDKPPVATAQPTKPNTTPELPMSPCPPASICTPDAIGTVTIMNKSKGNEP